MEHGDRAAFLGRLRARLVGGLPENPVRPYRGRGGPVPVVRYADPPVDLAERFTAAAEAVGARCRRLTGADVAGFVREVCEAEGVRRAVVSRDPECALVAEVLAEVGVDVVPFTGAVAAAEVDLGVTGAVAGIALTGSLVVASDRAGGRTASLLPPVHLALVDATRLVATAADVFRRLPEHFPSGLPSNVASITGPSRSADIELQITLGVHGPRAVWIGLVEA